MIRSDDIDLAERTAMLSSDEASTEPWRVLGVHRNEGSYCGSMSWVAIGDSRRTYARVGFAWRISGCECGDSREDREAIAQMICDAVNKMRTGKAK